MGKLFTCLYSIIGIVVVLQSLSPLMAFLKGDWREKFLELFGWKSTVDTDDTDLSVGEVNNMINYKRRYALALLGPVFVLFAGILMHYTMIREPSSDYSFVDWLGLIDSFYWAVSSTFSPRPFARLRPSCPFRAT